MNYVTRTTQLTVTPEDARVFDERSTSVTIEDEGAGEFVTISQPKTGHRICIEADDWPAIRYAVDQMIAETRKDGEK